MTGLDKDAIRERDRQFVIRPDGAVFPPSTRQDGIAAIRDRNCLLDALEAAEAERDRLARQVAAVPPRPRRQSATR